MTDFCKNCNTILMITKTLPLDVVGEQRDEKVRNGHNNRSDRDRDIDVNNTLDTATPNELSTDSNDDSKEGGVDETEDIDNLDNVDNADDANERNKYQKNIEIDKYQEDDERDAESEKFYESILKAVESNAKLNIDQMLSIDIKKMIKSDYYKSLKSKSDVKKKILAMIEDMGNSDENTSFHLFCDKCGYHRALDTGFNILSKNPEGVASTHNYSDDAKLRNCVHFGIYPRDRKFNCPNDKCISHKKGNATEAVMMREGATYNMIYVCVYCLAIKRLSAE